jgi:hypothetical protein
LANLNFLGIFFSDCPVELVVNKDVHAGRGMHTSCEMKAGKTLKLSVGNI